jgi:hypothetical protein
LRAVRAVNRPARERASEDEKNHHALAFEGRDRFAPQNSTCVEQGNGVFLKSLPGNSSEFDLNYLIY